MRAHPSLPIAALLALAVAGLAGCGLIGAPEENTYPLLGLHIGVSCEGCHPAGQPVDLTSSLCMGCHEDVRPPDHYDGDCALCHTEAGWQFIEVDHSEWLDLSGGHSDLECLGCHAEGTFAGLDAACASCHEQDRPNGHFAGPCEDCHVVADWEDAEFDHDPWFPVPHRGVDDCVDCHPNPNDYDIFTCIDCHEHRASEMNDEHDDVGGYEYNSGACYQCHPRGREEDDDG